MSAEQKYSLQLPEDQHDRRVRTQYFLQESLPWYAPLSAPWKIFNLALFIEGAIRFAHTADLSAAPGSIHRSVSCLKVWLMEARCHDVKPVELCSMSG